jgi:drug/metabolite transporter (DMT)-like permease
LGLGVLIAIVSSALGGTAAAVTRYLVGDADALTLAILRWGIGFVCVLPVALLLRVRWPARRDWPAVAALGRKSAGVGIAMLGAWRGELIMVGAVLCMAFYNVLSRPLMQRSSALGFLTVGMGFGAAVLALAGLATDRISVLSGFGAPQWIAGAYLGIGGGALAFILWVLALERATPTRVANTMTVNPIAAAVLATWLVDEPITANLIVGLLAVFLGIWIATTESRTTVVRRGALGGDENARLRR